jgi:hypothetical protein
MRSLVCSLVAAFALAATATPAAAQDRTVADTVQEIQLADGSRVYGRVVSETGDRLVVETVGGVRMEMDRVQVHAMRPVAGRVVGGELWVEDPNASRLFFAPTGRAVPAGEGYFGVFELFLPFLTYGVTDRFTISGGTPILPEVIGRVIYLAPKYELIRSAGTSAAVGVLAFFATEDALDGTAGLLYGVGTFGDRDRSITVGATVPFYAMSGESEVGRQPMFMIGGESRSSRRMKLLSENYFLPSEGAGMLSAGVRFIGERLSADVGLGAGFGDGDSLCCLPLVNFVYSFGRR